MARCRENSLLSISSCLDSLYYSRLFIIGNNPFNYFFHSWKKLILGHKHVENFVLILTPWCIFYQINFVKYSTYVKYNKGWRKFLMRRKNVLTRSKYVPTTCKLKPCMCKLPSLVRVVSTPSKQNTNKKWRRSLPRGDSWAGATQAALSSCAKSEN